MSLFVFKLYHVKSSECCKTFFLEKNSNAMNDTKYKYEKPVNTAIICNELDTETVKSFPNNSKLMIISITYFELITKFKPDKDYFQLECSFKFCNLSLYLQYRPLEKGYNTVRKNG